MEKDEKTELVMTLSPLEWWLLRTLCITPASLWQMDRDGLQGVFLKTIAGLLVRKATQQSARVRLITDHRELYRGFLRQF